MSEVKRTLRVLGALTLLTGILYPLAVTGVAQVAWPNRANGSLVQVNGRIVGSELVGQPFDDPGLFWPRPSATAGFPFNPQPSAGSNLGPTDSRFLDGVKQRMTLIRRITIREGKAVPVDLVTASGSGLDPHISPAAADFQVSRVARACGHREADLRRLIAENTENRDLGFLGERRVNVLKLNLALLKGQKSTKGEDGGRFRQIY